MIDATAYERLVDRLGQHGSTIRANGSDRALAQCPAHNDGRPSLSIRGISGQALVYCFAGCTTDEVLSALGMAKSDLFDDPRGSTYRYDDGRIVRRTPAKRFMQSGNTQGAPQLYRLSRLVDDPESVVYLVEGEKDVHAVESAGGLATCNPMGSINFGKVDVGPLRGRTVIAVVDRDAAGLKWAAQVRTRLVGYAANVEFVEAAIGKDAADHIAAGKDLTEFVQHEVAPEPDEGAVLEPPDEDLWAGAVDDEGYVRDDLDLDDPVGPEITAEPEHIATPEAAAVAVRRLPTQFWDSREIFKRIRQAAWATQTHPDAVLAAVLCRVAAMVPHQLKFDSGRGPHGSMNLFACLLARSGIGKSEAAATAEHLIQVPLRLQDPNVFKDGVGIGSGEGLAEVYMGVKMRDTGEVNRKGEPVEERVRTQVRHHAFFYVDEGEVINKLMRERQGTTLGPAIRSAWNGATLGQANARDETTRLIKGGTYSMGLLIGFQPDVAVSILSDVGPGTPQRLLWFGAQDTEMPEDEYDWPGEIALPPMPEQGVITFPAEIRQALRQYTIDKHRGSIEVEELDSHEPLMRCKLAAEFCLMDGRLDVNREDWALSGMIWATSTAIRDSLLQFRDHKAEQDRERQREARIEETRTVLAAHAEADADTQRLARVIANRVHNEGLMMRAPYRKSIASRDRQFFDAGLALARANGWVLTDEDNRTIIPGESRPG